MCLFAGQYAACAAAPEVLGSGDDLSTPTNPFIYHGLNILAQPGPDVGSPSTTGIALQQNLYKTTDPIYTPSIADGNNNTIPTAIVGSLYYDASNLNSITAVVAEQVVIKDSSSMAGGTFVAISAYLHARISSLQDVDGVIQEYTANVAIGIAGSSNGSTNSNCQQIVSGLGSGQAPTLVDFGGNLENHPSQNCVVDTLLFTTQDITIPSGFPCVVLIGTDNFVVCKGNTLSGLLPAT